MPVRTGVLARGHKLSGAVSTVATVPVGETWIVKEVICTNFQGSSSFVQVLASDSANTVSAITVFQTLAAVAFTRWDGFLVMTPGDLLRVGTDTVAVDFWVSGAKLVGIAV